MDDVATRTLLLDQIRAVRRHILQHVDGLDEEAMSRAVLPSGWSLTRMLHHLAQDDEHFWFANVVAGEPFEPNPATGTADGWVVPDGFTGAQAIAFYREQAERTDAIVAATPLDQAPAWWPDFFGSFRMDNLHEILLHHLVETSTHAGHIDAARELIDGKQWLVLE